MITLKDRIKEAFKNNPITLTVSKNIIENMEAWDNIEDKQEHVIELNCEYANREIENILNDFITDFTNNEDKYMTEYSMLAIFIFITI